MFTSVPLKQYGTISFNLYLEYDYNNMNFEQIYWATYKTYQGNYNELYVVDREWPDQCTYYRNTRILYGIV